MKEEILEIAKEHAVGNARHISDEYLRQANPAFIRLKIDSLGKIHITSFMELKEKSAFFEPNVLAGKNWRIERGCIYGMIR